MPPSARLDAEDALLPNAETALEAAETPPETAETPRETGADAESGAAAPDGTEAAAHGTEAAADGATPVPPPRRRGRPKGSKNRPKPVPAVPAAAAPAAVEPGAVPAKAVASSVAPAVVAPAVVPDAPVAASVAAAPATPRRRGRPPGRAARPVAIVGRADRLTIEQIVAIESPREPRLSPDGRRVAYTVDAAGARQVFVMDLRSGLARQLTASEHAVSDPQWSPDGAWLAYVRERAIWIVGSDGSRPVVVADHPAGQRMPRWAPDGRRLAFVSRRRGWDQVWVMDAPLPRRGRPPASPVRPVPRALTPAEVDVEDLSWSPDGTRIAVVAQRDADLATIQVTVVDVATGAERPVAGAGAWETSPRWLSDASGLLVVSDRDGWFQVVLVSLGDGKPTVLTAGPLDHGDYNNGFGLGPLPSPDGARFVHPAFRDGLVDLVVAPLAGAVPPKRRPGRPPKNRPAEVAAGAGVRINPGDGIWRAVGWLPDGSGILALGTTERDPEDLWILPAPGPDGSPAGRPRRLTRSLPAVIPVRQFVDPERHFVPGRDGTQVPVTLWRPPAATGKRGGTTVPTVVHVHGGPSSQVLRDFQPFRQLLVQEGFALLSVDFRGSTGYGRSFRLANRGEWGHADLHDVIDAARWAAAQPWSNGRLAIYGGSYGGYLVLGALVEEPALWTAGVDLYGDSEIAESFRHGDRVGRIDLQRMMGSPDDPENVERFRRGSPLYRAERIEAPLLILHGRRDHRVVPLMTEKMVEALEIEGKHHEVHWYAEEGHGWERRENRRDAFTRTLDWLRRYVREDGPTADGSIAQAARSRTAAEGASGR